jgi:hypothetical protein
LDEAVVATHGPLKFKKHRLARQQRLARLDETSIRNSGSFLMSLRECPVLVIPYSLIKQLTVVNFPLSLESYYESRTRTKDQGRP